MSEKQHFAYFVRPTRAGFAPDALLPHEGEAIGRHFEYLKGLLATGQLLLAGPCLDGSLGLGVLEVDGAAEAEALLAADPAVTAGVFAGEVRPMRLSLWRNR